MPPSSRSEPGAGRKAPATWDDVDDHRLHAKVMSRLFGEPEHPPAIGRFRVERRLGAGAMGVVYAAVDDQLGRRLALKLLHPHLAHDDHGRARLLREARAMARLEHEHVARIYEAGAWNEQVYLAMELVEGVTLDVWLKQRPRRWPEVVALFLQAGRALSAAHRAGLLHRDFKPENVLVDAHDRARVLDFGLTRALDDARDVDDGMLEPLTRTGSILGTPAYMAPEQLRSGDAEARSDQFSFCVALWEALYGARPYDHVPRFGALELAPAPKDSRVPARLRRALARGLAERPEDRWPAIDDLLAVLARPSRTRIASLAAGAIGGALVVGAVAVWIVQAKQAELDDAARSRLDSDRKLAELIGQVDDQAGALARQREAGERHARALRGHGAAADLLPDDPTAAALILRELDDHGPLAARALAEPISAAILAGHEGPVRSIRLLETAVETIDAAGARRRFPADGRGPGEAAGAGEPAPDPLRSPDGRFELVEHRGAVSLRARDDARERPLRGVVGPSAVAWSASSRAVAIAGPSGDIWIVPAKTGKPQHLGRHGAAARALAWAPGERRLAVGRDDGTVELWELRSRRSRRVALGEHDGPVAALGFRDDGRWLVSGGDDGTARVWSLQSTSAPARVLRGHRGPVRAVAFARADDRVVTGSDDGTARVWRLWPRALVTFDLGGPVNAVAWSPDGETIAAAGDRGVGVWLLPTDGGAGRALAHPSTVFAAAWSPDGESLATADAQGQVRLWPRRGGEPRVFAPGRRQPLLALAWEPGGSRLAAGGLDESIVIWSSDQTDPARKIALRRGSVDVLAWAPAGSRLAALTADGVLAIVGDGDPSSYDLGDTLGDLAWSPGGDALAVADERRGLLRVDAVDGTTTRLGRVASVWSVAWDPQDRQIVAGTADGSLHFVHLHGDGRAESLAGHGDVVLALAFDLRGTRLASAGADGRVIVWPRPDAPLSERLAAATSACLSPAQRTQFFGESGELASARSARCESASGRL